MTSTASRTLIYCALTAALLAPLTSTPAAATPQSATTKTYNYATSTLKIRSGPTTTAKILKTIPKGSKVAVTAHKNGWTKITKNGTTGWVPKKKLSTKKPEKVGATDFLTTKTIKKRYKNGRLPTKALCSVAYAKKQKMTCKAHADWQELNKAFKKKFRHNIPITLSYRTYAEQVTMRRKYGSTAAQPGTSNHGWGTAVDLPNYRHQPAGQAYRFGKPKYEWLKKHVPKYNWETPKWAQKNGWNPEPWHFEYTK